jgi:hypothetical protein
VVASNSGLAGVFKHGLSSCVADVGKVAWRTAIFKCSHSAWVLAPSFRESQVTACGISANPFCRDRLGAGLEMSQTAGAVRISVNRAATKFVKSSIPSPDLAETLNTCMPGRTA